MTEAEVWEGAADFLAQREFQKWELMAALRSIGPIRLTDPKDDEAYEEVAWLLRERLEHQRARRLRD